MVVKKQLGTCLALVWIPRLDREPFQRTSGLVQAVNPHGSYTFRVVVKRQKRRINCLTV